jgi:RNA polymerase sigma factor (sigma-70 family)
MEDRDIVAAVVAGDPAGLAEAYDRYAVLLYAYCRSMLREPADAADAVQDTFLIAAAKLRDLRDPARLRSWLYAVARNECLRRLQARAATSALDDAPDVPAPSAAPGIEAERAELQQLVRSAIDGLNPGDRDVIELSMGHELDGDDLADALGVSRNHAHAALSRARGQLERSLGALIVARTGREACSELDGMLAGWDGRLTVLMRKRISRHIEHCEICGERKRRELTPALYAGALPLVALVPGFRDHLLKIMADRSPAGLAHRLAVTNRAGPFGPSGFPKPGRLPTVSPLHRALRHSHVAVSHTHAVMAGAATSIVAVGAIVAVVVGGGTHQGSSGDAGARGGSTRGASASNGGSSARHGGPSPNIGNGVVPAALTAPAGSPGSTPGGATAPGAPGAPASSGSATSPASSSSSSSSTSPATSPSSSSPAGGKSPPPVSQGTLTVSSGQVSLVSINGTGTAKFTITASGGPVSNYSITVGSALLGDVAVSPATGSLASGGSATITVTTTSLLALDGQLNVNPGGLTVTVVISLGL